MIFSRCVVVGYSFYFGVLLPVATILLVNILVLILVIKSISTNTAFSNNSDDMKQIWRRFKVAVTFGILLGLTWIFALFAVGKATFTFQLLFCIFNSLQGFFIFAINIINNKSAREAWLRCFGEHGDYRFPSYRTRTTRYISSGTSSKARSTIYASSGTPSLHLE